MNWSGTDSLIKELFMIADEDIDVDFEEETGRLSVIFESEKIERSPEEAKTSLLKFFANREMYYGGEIMEEDLCTEKNISLLLNTTLSTGMARIYKALENDCNFNKKVSDSLIPDDVKLVLAIKTAVARMGLPQEFFAGLAIIYLEYCEGIQID